MANRWCDGFGRYGGTKGYMLNGSSGQAWAQVDDQFSLSNANPRTGSWHLRLDTNSSLRQVARRVFGAPLTEVFLGIAVYCHSLPTNETTNGATASTGGTFLFDLRDQSNISQISIWLGTDGALEARRGATVLDRTIPIVGAGAYQHVEVYATAGNGDGALEIRVDEVPRMNLTGINTVQTANVEFSQWAFGYAVVGATAVIDFADAYCNDTVDDGSGCNTFVGDVKSGAFMVASDTAQADFALSSGVTGHSLLSEAPPNDGTYITTPDTAAESDFGGTALPSNTSEVLTARPFDRAWKDDAGTCTIAPNMKSGGVKGTVTDQPVTTAPAYYDSNVPLDPDTGAPWTPAALSAALRVVERVS